jgi:hypothetical protein
MKIIFSILLFIVFPACITAQGKFFGGNGDGFATATIINQVLPLVIENFEARLEQNNVKLNFTINGDELACGIVIEKSRDGNVFTRIDSIHFNAGAYLAEKFAKQDIAVTPGNNYYRLRIMKCSGAFVYSKIIMIQVPVRNTFYYSSVDRKLMYYLPEPGVLKVYNSQGQLMINKILAPGSGSITIEMLATGLYFCQFAGVPAGKFLK